MKLLFDNWTRLNHFFWREQMHLKVISFWTGLHGVQDGNVRALCDGHLVVQKAAGYQSRRGCIWSSRQKKHDWTTNHMKHLQGFDHHQCRYGPTNMDHGVSFVENSEVVDAFKCVSHSFLFVMRSLNSFRRVGTPENQRFFMILITMKIRQNRSDTPGFFWAFNIKGWLEAASVSLITMCHNVSQDPLSCHNS